MISFLPLIVFASRLKCYCVVITKVICNICKGEVAENVVCMLFGVFHKC